MAVTPVLDLFLCLINIKELTAATMHELQTYQRQKAILYDSQYVGTYSLGFLY
jgi:hypothetical protein